MDEVKGLAQIGDGVGFEGGLLVDDVSTAPLLLRVTAGPCCGIEEVLVIDEIGLVGEEKINATIMFVDDGLGVVVEGQIDVPDLFPDAFIGEGEPEVFVIAHEHVRFLEGFREDDVMLGGEFVSLFEPPNGGSLNRKFMDDGGIASQAIGLRDRGPDVAAGRLVEKPGSCRSEHDEAFTVGVIGHKVLDELHLKERAK